MPVFRRSLAILAAAILALLPVLSASASTADDLDAAKQQLAAARSAATDARTAAYNAEVQVQQTEDHINDVEQTISDLKAQAASLHDIVRKRALYAYTHAGSDIDVIVSTDDPLSAARGQTLIDQANQKDNAAVKRLAGINSDLHDQTTELRDQESKQRAEKDRLDAWNTELEASLAAAADGDDRAPGAIRPGDRGRGRSSAKGGARTRAGRRGRGTARRGECGRDHRPGHDRREPESERCPERGERLVHVPGLRRHLHRRLRRTDGPPGDRHVGRASARRPSR